MVLLIASVAYLLGSIPFGFLLVWLVRKEDIRTTGSGNIGATNVIRSGAKGLGVLTFLLDAGKGWAAVKLAELLARHAGHPTIQNAMILAAFCAIAGHVFPLWLGFKGGKGVATAFGGFLALSPWAALCALGVFFAVFVLTRYVSAASIVAAISFPFLTLLLFSSSPTRSVRILLFACSALVIVKHRQNIVRLAHGTEYRFGKSRPREA